MLRLTKVASWVALQDQEALLEEMPQQEMKQISADAAGRQNTVSFSSDSLKPSRSQVLETFLMVISTHSKTWKLSPQFCSTLGLDSLERSVRTFT